MDALIPLLTFLSGAAAAWWLLARQRSRARARLVVYDGERLVVYVARLKDGHLLVPALGKDFKYPRSIVRLADNTSDTAAGDVYVMGVQAIALAQHDALEVGRQSIVFSSLFKSGGDLLRILQMAAVLVPIVAAVWSTLQVGGLQGAVNSLAVDVKLVREVVSKPLVTEAAP